VTPPLTEYTKEEGCVTVFVIGGMKNGEIDRRMTVLSGGKATNQRKLELAERLKRGRVSLVNDGHAE
jgi:hypothetical protein